MPPSRSTQNCLTVLHGPVVILTGAQIAVAHRLVLAGTKYLQGAGIPLRSAERATISELQSATSDMRAQHQRQHHKTRHDLQQLAWNQRNRFLATRSLIFAERSKSNDRSIINPGI